MLKTEEDRALIEKTQAEERSVVLLETAKNMIIVTNEDRIAAETFIQGVKTLEDEIFKDRDEPRARAYKEYLYHKSRLDEAIKPPQEARKIAKQKCIQWDSDQEALRRQEQLRLEKLAIERAEREALELATTFEESGDKETAEAILEAPLDIAPVVAQKTAPAASRLTAGRSVWSGEVVNLMMLVKAVAEGKEPISLLMINQPNLNNAAKLIKINGKTQNGWKVVEKKV